MSSPYPRVLLVNAQPISRRYANGIAMGNLFRGWPIDRIAQIYCDDSAPDETVCSRSWRLEVEDAPMPGWLQRWVRRGSKTAYARYVTYARFSVPQEVSSGVTAFRPDVIYSSLEVRRITGLALDLARRLSVPLIPHFMDDWLTGPVSPPRGPLAKMAQRDLEHKALRALHDAPVNLVIGEYMADAYERRYGRRFVPFMNCVDLDERPVISTVRRDDGVFRFGFTGRLLFSRDDALVDVVDALGALHGEGVRTELVVYQHDPGEELPEHIVRSPVVRLADLREEALLETADCEIDAFLHVDTFEERARRYLQFSLSGKVPWYLAAGVPLFAYGAPEPGTMRFLRDQKCAAVVDRRDSELLRRRLRDLVRDDGVRRDLGARARLVAQEYFDARVKREAFRRVLSEACTR